MTYTNTWNESVPVGGAPANTVDDNFRQLKTDVRERINTLIGSAIATPLADPVIAAGKGMIATRTFKVWIPWHAMAFISSAGTLSPPQSYATSTVGIDVVQGTHGTGYFHCPLRLPVGATILSATATPPNNYINFNQSAGTIVYEVRLYKKLYTDTVGTQIGTASGSGAMTGIQYPGFGPALSDQVVAIDTEYHVSLSLAPSAGTTCTFFGLAYSFTTPDYTIVNG